MKRQPLTHALITAALLGSALAAQAHGNVQCTATSKEERKPQMELQGKLEAEGWKVRQVKTFNNCYEVYGIDNKGRKAEAFFHPKTFERVYPEGETPDPVK
jgi:hypothetical protein